MNNLECVNHLLAPEIDTTLRPLFEKIPCQISNMIKNIVKIKCLLKWTYLWVQLNRHINGQHNLQPSVYMGD